jgi:hypothetical protein
VIFGGKERVRKNIIVGSRESYGSCSSLPSDNGGLVRDTSMSRVSLPVGDLNGDHKEDLLICDPTNSFCFVYLRTQDGGFAHLQVSFAIRSTENDLFGWSAASLQDVNKDGFDDIAISALSSNVIYVLFGSNNLPSHQDMIINSNDNNNKMRIVGLSSDQNSGLALSSAGDFNNDGIPDLLYSAIESATFQNVIYILFFYCQ